MGDVGDSNKFAVDKIFNNLIEQSLQFREEKLSKSEFLKIATVSLIQLKTLNREMQLALDEKRKDVATKKVVVDKLQLDLENLLYKQADLNRDIRICKDISTPNLDAIEKELQHPLGTLVYEPNLAEIHQQTLDTLRQEQEARIKAQSQLDELEEKSKQRVELLDRKRKFLEDLPSKMKLVRAAAQEVETQFDTMLQENSNSASSEDSNKI